VQFRGEAVGQSAPPAPVARTSAHNVRQCPLRPDTRKPSVDDEIAQEAPVSFAPLTLRPQFRRWRSEAWDRTAPVSCIYNQSPMTQHVAIANGATSIDAGRRDSVGVRGSEVLLGDPLVMTKARIDQFDF
jgi:hypothetical protein